jgi:hypothetical protein
MTTASLPADLVLRYGSHASAGNGNGPCCLIEAEVVHVLHKPKKDTDPTICPVIQKMATGLNDSYPNSLEGDAARTADLARFLGCLSNTKSTPAVEEQRSLLALDWLVRVYTPSWLRLVPVLVPDAVALETAHRVESLESAAAIGEIVRTASANAAVAWAAAWAAARAAAGDAAWAAAGDAARAAAGDAAWAAAWAAAWDAAWAAAGDAARDAAGDAAWAAARAAAGDAAWAALQPTVDALRASAIALLDTMLAVSS